uniref:Uncharacterized protein n=1 Tax=Pseudo-nitzschia australis TaxID=44445 RepID=A0A7S4EQW5_9STRA|mmetsp:Transcript_968/g.2216  ORF Transcript_968/g.2216 Transcript_968/m.2216 type:complete len:471 (+) Transcript_968:208-1620(+)|eukprot:CAMPEP_0168193204 /NCGR_PEP_ID=MMETSP0139_2-20121125/18472_1 /TAXON_ID=44445 /ORGANISM="Pseudo-nitzschia australis, Strain 10249 10 AB" /LENGTH=470 /DNA_ID=CAMNT_0008116525 /DNA_START=146 /DNA_END=1558 /DNA_ORIENTATION=+
MERIKTKLGFCTICIGTWLTLEQYAATASAFSLGVVGQTTRNRRVSHSALTATNGGDFGELTSALATLDQQWQIQQQSSAANGKGKPRWSKLILPPKEDSDDVDSQYDATSDTTTTTNPFNKQEEEFVWMLEPPSSSIPSCVVVFTGGAGLGQFPQVAYNELLSKISDKLNAVCVTAPYEVGLDHFSLAKQTGERLRRALLVLNDDRNGGESNTSTSTDDDFRSRLPTYSLAHSLGCKLQTIYMAATGLENSFDGIGFMAYNNFSFAKTITMGRSFAQELRGGTNANMNMNMGTMGNPEMMNSIFDFAEMAVGAIGLDFSPNSQDTERLIQLRYNGDVQAKTRLFIFDEDNLDSSQEFKEACQSISDADGNAKSGSGGLQVSNLPGGHLTPVFFEWNVDELAKEAMGGLGDNFTPENIDMAKEAIGGFQGASFGDEENFGALVDEVCDWILGKPPTTVSIPRISSSIGEA